MAISWNPSRREGDPLPPSRTFVSLVEDELIGLDFPLETAKQICQDNLGVIEESEYAGCSAISVAEQLAEINADKKAEEHMQEMTALGNAKNRRSRELYTPYRVLHGHDSVMTAYVVDDYPFSFQIRCRIRYWVETAEKGQKKGMQRVVAQTSHKSWNAEYTRMLTKHRKVWAETGMQEHLPQYKKEVNPLVREMECKIWNKPKPGPYLGIVILYADEQDFVHTNGLSEFAGPNEFNGFRNMWKVNTEFCELSKEQLERLIELEKFSKKYNPNTWGEWMQNNPYSEIQIQGVFA